MDEVIRDATKKLAVLGRKDLLWLKKQLRRELHRRWVDGRSDHVRKVQGWEGLANFMAGVTWAMACRQSLRRSKGHTPDGGKRPQSGEMWLPRELVYAVRHEVRERHWSPLAAQCWADVKGHLEGETAKRLPEDADVAVQFHVRLAQGNAATVTAETPLRRTLSDPRIWEA